MSDDFEMVDRALALLIGIAVPDWKTAKELEAAREALRRMGTEYEESVMLGQEYMNEVTRLQEELAQAEARNVSLAAQIEQLLTAL